MKSAFIKKILKQKFYAWWHAQQKFSFNHQQYHYFSHQYNWTWLNERSLEIPLAWRLVEQYRNKQILEIGNVLNHYFDFNHTVVDKYEQAKGVINQDIIAFDSKQKFDLIIAISTFEHIGWDEEKKDKRKIPKAIKKCQQLLKPKGKLLITFPIAYNSYLDDLVYQQKLTLKLKFLHRIDVFNHWQEISLAQVKKLKPQYNQPFNNANVIGVASN